MVAAAESASRHDLNALNYPILPKSPSASKSEIPELPNSAHTRKRPRNSHIFARAANDLYVERPRCSERLFAVETFPGTGWDCCCGTGTIIRLARAAGLETYGTDISDGCDFLSIEPVQEPPVFSIVTNPPFALTPKIVEHALALGAVKIAIFFPTASAHTVQIGRAAIRRATACWMKRAAAGARHPSIGPPITEVGHIRRREPGAIAPIHIL
jgi:hypothetical protein